MILLIPPLPPLIKGGQGGIFNKGGEWGDFNKGGKKGDFIKKGLAELLIRGV